MTHATGPWRKSSRSGGNAGNNCVEARLSASHPQLADSQYVGTRPIIDVARTDYAALLDTIKTTNS